MHVVTNVYDYTNQHLKNKRAVPDESVSASDPKPTPTKKPESSHSASAAGIITIIKKINLIYFVLNPTDLYYFLFFRLLIFFTSLLVFSLSSFAF